MRQGKKDRKREKRKGRKKEREKERKKIKNVVNGKVVLSYDTVYPSVYNLLLRKKIKETSL